MKNTFYWNVIYTVMQERIYMIIFHLNAKNFKYLTDSSKFEWLFIHVQEEMFWQIYS